MAENTNSQELSTVYWDPKAEITLTGAELAGLFQVVDLQHVSTAQVPFSKLAEIYGLSSTIKNAIVERMNKQGLLFDAPVEDTVVEPVDTSTEGAPV